MRILLMAMPDCVDLIDHLVKIPNIALVSLAGNLTEHEVKVLDLVVYGKKVRQPITQALEVFKPDIIGLSAMTFQFDSALKIARFLRKLRPDCRLVCGGYHATLMAEEISSQEDFPFDFLVKGEAEKVFAELCSHLEKGLKDFSGIPGISYKDSQGEWIHNPRGDLLDLSEIRLPDRDVRLTDDFFFLYDKNWHIDVIETSRGCPFLCKFCSINKMYGSTFRKFPVDRIIEDLKQIKSRGTRAVFIVDDNITYDVQHFRRICKAIIEHKLNDIFYIVQVSAAGIANNPELVDDMDKANFRTVFVGFESMLPTALKDMKKPTSPEINIRAADLLRKHNMGIIAGLIAGYPEDTRESVIKNFRGIMKLLPDLLYPQYLTPYPKTRLREEMLEAGLVVNADDFSLYDGYHCNIKTKYLSQKQLYRILRTEMIWNFLYPSIIFTNFYLKNFFWNYIRRILKNFFVIIWNALKGQRPALELDIID